MSDIEHKADRRIHGVLSGDWLVGVVVSDLNCILPFD